MQKIFIKYLSIVMTIAIISMISLSYLLQSHSAQNRMKENSLLKLNQIAATIERNKKALIELNEILDKSYISKTKIFAYIIQKNPDVLKNKEELEYIKILLAVNELHVSNKYGILEYSTTEQTKEFLILLDDPLTFAQNIRPNAANQNLF